MESKSKILIVEDEQAIRQGLEDLFAFHGFEVSSSADGAQGLEMALAGGYDLILLDVMLPNVDGFTICNRIREQDRKQPIIMLTAKSSEEDIIKGLTLGADDYIAKPFSVQLLVLRAQAVLRRSGKAEKQSQEFLLGESLRIDTKNMSSVLLINGEESQGPDFTRREIDLLLYLRENGVRPVPRAELLTKVWGYSDGADIETRTVDIHIAKLRRKIEDDPKDPKLLVTIRGEGYRLADG